jgi:hypothetical protein
MGGEEEMKPFGRPSCRWEDNINKMDLKGIV